MEVPLRPLRGVAAAVMLCGLGAGPLMAQPPVPPSPSPSPSPRPAAAAASPVGTDIFLLDLSLRGGTLTLGKPSRLTDRAGYDNQPFFSPDGRSLYYTAIEDGQADIQHHDLASHRTTPLARTSESEYSPTPTPEGGVSVIRVEANDAQRLWRLRAGQEPELLLPDVKPVGYHAWYDADTLVLFVLGDPPTLRVVERRSGRAETVAGDVGRCIRQVPGRRGISFVEKVSPGEWWLTEVVFPARTTKRLARMPQGVEDYAWLPDGRVLAGQGARLLELPASGGTWRQLAAFDDPALQNLTRLAVSPQGDRLALVSDEPVPFALTVDGIMRGPELVGYPPSALRWSGDAKELFFEWRTPGEDEAATWVASRTGGEPRRLTDEERRSAPGADCEWDEARRRCLFAADGDIVLVDTVARTRRQITRTTATETSPRFAKGDQAVTFVRENNLFLAPLGGQGDLTVQVTNVGPKKKEPRLTESQKFLKEEERKLLKHVEQEAARKKREEEKKEREAPPKLDVDETQSVPDAALSDDGRFAYLLVARKAKAARSADVPDYITESSYSEMIPARTNVGDRQETRRLAIVDGTTRKVAWAWVEGVTEPEPEKKADEPKPDAVKPEGDDPKPEDAEPRPKGRQVAWTAPVLSPDGSAAIAAVRAVDNKDRWLVLLDPSSGKGRVLDHQHDDAWVRGGGFGAGDSFGWIDGKRIWFLSESTGFQHLYTKGLEDTAPRALTSGRFEVFDARLDRARTSFLLTTNEVHAGERHLYRVPVAGGALVRLTQETGAHLAVVSPDGGTLADVYSNGRTPPEVYLTPTGSKTLGRRVTVSTRPAFRAFAWQDPPVVTFKARDGVDVPARLFTPESVGASRDPHKPGVVFVHGAGWLQNAHRFWSTYYREYFFHHLLASRGYVVIDVDYRGSAGYGRDWRTAVAGFMGGKDLEDVVDAARFLVEKERVDPRRVGVYGGSYGGFITLMALFTTPDVFAAGAALRPVTDWAHYNHPYTSNILGVPPQDAEAYRKSSPIHFAEGLKGALLICHGMVDTNVHFQDSVRLAQRLIELRKENWELAVYPVENHGFEEATSWADEYKRILALFERTLRGAPPS
jgi:dipeptidyl aminopeptidase/acylaminoacyl peptidase